MRARKGIDVRDSFSARERILTVLYAVDGDTARCGCRTASTSRPLSVSVLDKADRQQVTAGGDHHWVAFDDPSCPHCRIEALAEAVRPQRAQGGASRAFDPIYLDIAESRIDQVLRQLIGKVEVRGRKADDVTTELAGRMGRCRNGSTVSVRRPSLPMSIRVRTG